jgi:Ca2+-binding RTX toxin-like protein
MTQLTFGNIAADMTGPEWFGYGSTYDTGGDFDIVYVTGTEVLLRDPGSLATIRFRGVFDTTNEATILASPLDAVEWREGGGGLLFDWSSIGTTIANALASETNPAVIVAALSGADAIDSGSGDDRLRGYDGNDTIDGGAGADLLDAGAGDDSLSGDEGNDTIDGGSGKDVAWYGGFRADFSVTLVQGGVVVTDLVGVQGTDTVLNVERLEWDMGGLEPTGALALDIDGIAGQAYRIYKAAFDREPDLAGLGYWIAQLDAGATLLDAATGFLGSAEFQSLYGVNPSNEEYTRALYLNVLDREPDEAGYAYWNAMLLGEPWNGTYYGQTTREQMLVDFSESAENQANVADLIAGGIDYLQWWG